MENKDINKTYTCNRCNEEKPIELFYRPTRCKQCVKEQQAEWYQNNKDRVKQYQADNAEQIKEYQLATKEIRNKNSRDWHRNNKDKVKQYQVDNAEHIKTLMKEWRKENKDRLREWKREYEKNRKLNDPLYLIKHKTRTTIGSALRRKGYSKNSKTYDILGCSFEEFKTHIESQWEPWMTWNNHGKYNGEYSYGWDIDHIVPLESVISEQEVIKLNHYTNLQPLCSKINRYEKKF